MLHTEAISSLIKREGEEVIWSNQQGVTSPLLISFLLGFRF